MKIRKSKAAVIVCIVVTMIATTAAPAFAKAPAREKTEYEGKGRVEVEFKGNVKYKKPKVTVKDTKGKKYSASIVKRDSDDLTFVIKKYKEGRTYKYTIKGLKKSGTKKYGKVKGTVKIPVAKAVAAPKNVTAANANNIAIADAVKVYKIVQSTVSKLTCKLDGKKYEIEFIAEKSDGTLYEFEYEISLTGGVIERDQEYKSSASAGDVIIDQDEWDD